MMIRYISHRLCYDATEGYPKKNEEKSMNFRVLNPENYVLKNIMRFQALHNSSHLFSAA